MTLLAAGKDAGQGTVVVLGDRSHTGPEVLSALQAQAQRWLTPRQLKPGMVVQLHQHQVLGSWW